jgi:hypothetical protein
VFAIRVLRLSRPVLRLVSSSPIVSVSDQPFAGDFRFAYHSWEFFSLLFKKSLLS